MIYPERMTAKYLNTLLSSDARALQAQDGSREIYANMENRAADAPDRLTSREMAFIAQRDSFYMATVTEDGWPYVQHRGGDKGFLKTISDSQLAFIDLRGNRQFMSAGNVRRNERVSLFLMDYPNRRRLKIAGLGRHVSASDAADLISSLAPDLTDIAAGAFLIEIVAYDWNCPKYITPRWTADELHKSQDIFQ